MGSDPLLFTEYSGPSFYVSKRNLGHYKHYYKKFLKEDFIAFRKKMRLILLHDQQTLDFNYIMDSYDLTTQEYC